MGYSLAYLTVALLFITLSILIYFKMPEPEREIRPYISVFSEPKNWFKDSFIEPVKDLYQRYQSEVVLLLLLIFFYRLSDVFLGPMAMPFYKDTGFTKEEVAIVTNAFGILMTMIGVLVGGILIYLSLIHI